MTSAFYDDGPQSRSLTSGLVPVALMVFGNIIFAFNDVWLRRVADDIGIAQTVWGRSILFLLIMTFRMSRSDWRQMYAQDNGDGGAFS